MTAFLSFIIRPPPASPPFPYTTLFRSVLIARADGGIAADVRPLVRLSVQVIAEQNGRRETGSAGGGGRGEDRKSTRLNSSHRCISYAVFCLKKKKREQ